MNVRFLDRYVFLAVLLFFMVYFRSQATHSSFDFYRLSDIDLSIVQGEQVRDVGISLSQIKQHIQQKTFDTWVKKINRKDQLCIILKICLKHDLIEAFKMTVDHPQLEKFPFYDDLFSQAVTHGNCKIVTIVIEKYKNVLSKEAISNAFNECLKKNKIGMGELIEKYFSNELAEEFSDLVVGNISQGISNFFSLFNTNN
ncbi:MAG: hypothetical protein V1855_00710 [bacterium]